MLHATCYTLHKFYAPSLNLTTVNEVHKLWQQTPTLLTRDPVTARNRASFISLMRHLKILLTLTSPIYLPAIAFERVSKPKLCKPPVSPTSNISFIQYSVWRQVQSLFPRRFLHIVRFRASSFSWEYPLLSLRSSSSFLRLLPRLLVTSLHLSFLRLSRLTLRGPNTSHGSTLRHIFYLLLNSTILD
jgi:hypothetical protein